MSGQTACAGSCVVLASDASNCGACGNACAAGESCRAGACVSGCTVNGRFVAKDTVDGCRVCDPSRSTMTLSQRADGSSCGAGICTAGACSAGCTIDGVFVNDLALNPANPCERCESLTSSSAWTVVANGTACGTGQLCTSAVCSTGCFISNVFYADGALNPANPCERCAAATSTAVWIPLTDGAACGNGQVCSTGACGGGCFIDGATHATGAVNPANACEHCAPGTSTTAWTARADGQSCGMGSVCGGGSCAPQCFIDGQLVAMNAENALNACEFCVPPLSTTTWSSRADGYACAAGKVCAAGACSDACFIDAGIVMVATENPDNECEACVPSVSTTSWSTRANGESCGSGQICNGGACTSGCSIDGGFVDAGFVNPANGCEICEPASSTSTFTGRAEVPLLDPTTDLAAQGWTLVTQMPFVSSTGTDYVRYATTTAGSTSGQFLLSRRVADAGEPFTLRVEAMVESVSPHNTADSAAAILGSFTPPFGTSDDRSQMTFLDGNRVGWADDSAFAPFANVDGAYHRYELAVVPGGASTFSVDGTQLLTRNNFSTTGIIAIGDQTNDPNVDAAMRIRSVSLVCQ